MTPPTRRLAPCPQRPNCVCSQAHGRAHVAPLTFSGSAAAAMVRLERIVRATPRTRVVEASEHYLRAEARSRIFGFVDDVEFLADANASVIHVRSAARVGFSDLGVNRARVEKIRVQFELEGR